MRALFERKGVDVFGFGRRGGVGLWALLFVLLLAAAAGAVLVRLPAGYRLLYLVLLLLAGLCVAVLVGKRSGTGRVKRRGGGADQDEAAEQHALVQRLRERQERISHAECLVAIGRMSAEVAHQIRNPLGAISLNIELLRDEIESLNGKLNGEAAALIDAVEKEIEALTNLTGDYLQFARLPRFHWRRQNPNRFVQKLFDFLKPEIERRRVLLNLRLDPQMPPMWLDGSQLKVALMNVVMNALEAMETGGRLSVSTKRDRGRLVISVRDTGVGVAHEDMGKVFAPFYTTKEDGTGLGLSLTRRIVEGHGGTIRGESLRGIGTAFYMTIPIRKSRPPEQVITSDRWNVPDEVLGS